MPTISRRLKQARERCKQTGARLTKIRENVLKLLLESDKPLSAYELLERFQAQQQSPVQPMTIYRALSFLENQSLIHKLNSTRQYVACDHLHDHQHNDLTQFLMCDQCGEIEESPLPEALWKLIRDNAGEHHFLIQQPNLEIHGLCQQCQQKPVE